MTDKSGIIAIATPTGRSGIGVIRISGNYSQIRFLWDAVVRIPSEKPRYAYFTPLHGADGTIIDNGIALWFSAPHSYTGEDVLELQLHGNPVILNLMVSECLKIGAAIGLRRAEPGEFTRRAFENGKIDLSQAEAVMDLINATSEESLKAARRSLSGDFSHACHDIRNQIIKLRTQVEAILDFPEEDIEFIEDYRICEQLCGIRHSLRLLLDNAKQGKILQEGVSVALVGSPNVGKSSLLNLLSERDVSIVTNIPGTTRDIIENTIIINGLLVRLFDTAGLRESRDIIEQVGIQRALDRVREADLVIWMTAPDVKDNSETERLISENAPKIPVIKVVNKSDLSLGTPAVKDGEISISVKHNLGMEALKNEILNKVGYRNSVQGVFAARARHVELLEQAQSNLVRAGELLSAPGNAPLDLVAEELKQGADAIGRVAGEFSTEDLLGKIFSSFCIGK